MKLRYSIYEAKTKLSEIIRHVKLKRRITITDRGREVARVVPIEDSEDVDQRIADLVAAGVLSADPENKPGAIQPVARRRGALERFLRDRDS